MHRLTQFNTERNCYEFKNITSESPAAKLYAYEDLNLSPAEIAEKLKELAELRKATRWIPVSERLPEYSPSGTVKSYWVAYDTSKGKQMQIAVYSDYMYSTLIGIPPCVTWRDYESHKIKNVTHWMPLPEPPKGE
jgi:hypothetical protein